jgi:hypothetical protein
MVVTLFLINLSKVGTVILTGFLLKASILLLSYALILLNYFLILK